MTRRLLTAILAAVLLVAACGQQGIPSAVRATHPRAPESGVSATDAVPSHSSAASGPAPVTATRLESALLTRFRGTRRLAPSPGAERSVVVMPSPQYVALARKYGPVDFPVWDSRCRPWVAGLWSTALHTPGLESTAATAITDLYGAYTKPKAHSPSLSDVSLMEIVEVIVEAPSGTAAGRLAAGPVPARCQQTRLWSQQARNLPFKWYPGHVKRLNGPAIGLDSGAVSVSVAVGVPFLHRVWSDTFRLNNYVIEVDAVMWPGVRNPALALHQLATAAYDKARAALVVG